MSEPRPAPAFQKQRRLGARFAGDPGKQARAWLARLEPSSTVEESCSCNGGSRGNWWSARPAGGKERGTRAGATRRPPPPSPLSLRQPLVSGAAGGGGDAPAFPSRSSARPSFSHHNLRTLGKKWAQAGRHSPTPTRAQIRVTCLSRRCWCGRLQLSVTWVRFTHGAVRGKVHSSSRLRGNPCITAP